MINEINDFHSEGKLIFPGNKSSGLFESNSLHNGINRIKVHKVLN